MTITNNTISDEMLEILKRQKGLRLGTILSTGTGTENGNDSFQVVILRFAEHDIEIWNEEQENTSGKISDISKISIRINRLQNTQSPIGKYREDGIFSPSEFIALKVDAEIGDITIVNDEITCVNSNGKKEFSMNNTRAIVIAIGNRYLHLEKSNYWSELWSVNIKATADASQETEWKNEDGYTYVVETSMINL